ncbi:MAG: hypothetical protein FRX49_08860 [Trebouxia sp. A1-2]|nr:MAG: hypothetical protein FRX49_08860 [Trebouxia sp. A1-2]
MKFASPGEGALLGLAGISVSLSLCPMKSAASMESILTAEAVGEGGSMAWRAFSSSLVFSASWRRPRCEKTRTDLAPLEEVDWVVVSRAMRSRMNGLLGSGNSPTTKLCPGSGALSTNTCHAHETWITHYSVDANSKGAEAGLIL